MKAKVVLNIQMMKIIKSISKNSNGAGNIVLEGKKNLNATIVQVEPLRFEKLEIYKEIREYLNRKKQWE